MSASPDTSPTEERAATINEGGAVNLDGYDWPALGERPSSPTEAVYEPLKEPKAQHDNDVENATRENLKRLNKEIGDLKDRLGDLEGDVTQLREDHNNLEDAFRQHNHDSRYPRQYDVYYREEADNTFAPLEHNHDKRYWRKHLAEDRYLNSTPEGDRGEGRISLPELEMRVGEGFEIVGDGDYWGTNNDARLFRAKDSNADGGFVWEFADLNGENRQEMLAIRAPDKNDSITHGGATVWHADNDGHTSGLDADKLDDTHLQTIYDDLLDSRERGDTARGNINFEQGADFYGNRLSLYPENWTGEEHTATAAINFRQGPGHPSIQIWEEDAVLQSKNGSDYQYFHWYLESSDSTLVLHDDVVIEGNLTVDGSVN